MKDNKDGKHLSREELITELQNALSEVLKNEPMRVSTVLSGPFENGDSGTFFRIGDRQSSQVVSFNPVFIENSKSEIRAGSEVLVIGAAIVAVLPEALVLKNESQNITLVSWEKIGGLKSQVQKIREAVEMPIKYAELSAEMGLAPINGILLHGKPGNGKTLIAKAIASTILGGKQSVDPAAFTYIKGASILSHLVSVAEKEIERMFAEARKYAKKSGQRAVIFIDEAEAILSTRGSRRSSDVDTTIVPTFLAEMSGMGDEKLQPIVILATNKTQDLDPAILRHGRMDLKIHVEEPQREDFAEMLSIHLSDVKTSGNVHEIAKQAAEMVFEKMPGKVSGATAKTVVTFASQNAVRRAIQSGERKNIGITTLDMAAAIEQVQNN